jgi:hypothetical protein
VLRAPCSRCGSVVCKARNVEPETIGEGSWTTVGCYNSGPVLIGSKLHGCFSDTYTDIHIQNSEWSAQLLS